MFLYMQNTKSISRSYPLSCRPKVTKTMLCGLASLVWCENRVYRLEIGLKTGMKKICEKSKLFLKVLAVLFFLQPEWFLLVFLLRMFH